MSQLPISPKGTPPIIIGRLQAMLRGLKGDTGDVTPEANLAKELAEQAATDAQTQASVSTTKAGESSASAAAAAVSEANAAGYEQGAFEASGLFVDLGAFDTAVVDNKMGGIKSADPNIAYALAQKVGGVSSLTGAAVPSANAVLKPVQSGKLNGWPDTFFRHAAFGANFLGRRRYFEYTPGNFSGYQLVPTPAPFDGNAIRRVIDGTTIPAGPLIWLDEIGATVGDTITIYVLISSQNAGFVQGRARFLNSVYNGVGSLANMLDAAGVDGVVASTTPLFLRYTAVVPATAVSIGIYHQSPTAGSRPDMIACWAFKGGIDKGPAYPVFDDSAYLNLQATQQQATIAAQAADLVTANSKIASLEAATPPAGLRDLKLALSDDFCQFLGIVLIGDSITWGMSATGIAPINPRANALTDARNNGSSPSWANLLHKYLGLQYYKDSEATETAWPGTPSGVAIFEYNNAVSLFPGSSPFVRSNTNVSSPGAWTQSGVVGGTKLGYYIQALVNTATGLDNLRLKWTMTGYEFDLVFAAQSNGAKYDLIVDGVTLGTYSTQTTDTGLPISFGNVRTHSLGGFKRNAVVELRVVPGDAARINFRVEAVTMNRRLRVTNQGIIGIAAATYSNVMLNAARQEGDQFALVQPGTNDRALTSAQGPVGTLTFRTNLERIADTLVAANITPIFMCANAVPTAIDVPPVVAYSMNDVRDALRTFAGARRFDYIDHFAETKVRLDAGEVGLIEASGPHPLDPGMQLSFDETRQRIDAA